MKLVTFLKNKSIDIALLQEHNIKYIGKIEYIIKYYHVILNKSILLKGGTLILIDKRLPDTTPMLCIIPEAHISDIYSNS